MQHYAAFHLGLHCLQKYSFRGFPNTKGKCLKCCSINKIKFDKDFALFNNNRLNFYKILK